MLFSSYQASLAHMGEMKRERIGWDLQLFGKLTGLRPVSAVLDQKLEDFESSLLSERSKCFSGFIHFHVSRIMERCAPVKATALAGGDALYDPLTLYLGTRCILSCMSQDNFTIGELAKKAKINVQTVRYYERRRLVWPSKRSDAGYRFYTASELKRVLFIKKAQDLGFTLKEIQDLLNLRARSTQSCQAVQMKAEVKLADVRGKIRSLREMERVLVELVSDCERNNPTSSCPMLEKMEDT